MDNDLKIEKLRADIITAINTCDLSISVIYYALKPIMQELEEAYVRHSQDVIAKYQAETADMSENISVEEAENTPKISAEEVK